MAEKKRKRNQIVPAEKSEPEIDIPFNAVLVSNEVPDVPPAEKTSHRNLVIAIGVTTFLSFLFYFFLFFPVDRFINRAFQYLNSSFLYISAQEKNGTIWGSFSFENLKLASFSNPETRASVASIDGDISLLGLANNNLDLELKSTGWRINLPDILIQISILDILGQVNDMQMSKATMAGSLSLEFGQLRLEYQKNLMIMEKVPPVVIPAFRINGKIANSSWRLSPERKPIFIRTPDNQNMKAGELEIQGEVKMLYDGYLNITINFYPSEELFEKYPFKEILVSQGYLDASGSIVFFIQGNFKNLSFRPRKNEVTAETPQ